MSLADSIKAKLLDTAKKLGREYNEVLSIYGVERTLYRLSISPYKDHFILKGGALLYAMNQGDYQRSTADVDFLGIGISDHIDEIKNAFIAIFSIDDPNDGITFDIKTIKITRISEFKKYPGVAISIKGYLQKTQINVFADVAFGDVIYPEKAKMTYPTLLDQNAPNIMTYSVESIIAEKFEALISLGKIGTRIKDLYDIFVLSRIYSFNGMILKEAIDKTISNRKTSFEDLSFFNNYIDSNKKRLWASFVHAKKIRINLELEQVYESVKSFILPVYENIDSSTYFAKKWDANSQIWI